MNLEEPYDAIVVGTGISGGWAAIELCEPILDLYGIYGKGKGPCDERVQGGEVCLKVP